MTKTRTVKPRDYATEPFVEFTVVRERFDLVRPMVQELFRHARGRGGAAQVVFTPRQKVTLWRHRSRRILFIEERNMRIIEPVGHPGITVLKTDMNNAFLRLLSALMPEVEFVEFESMIEGKRVQRHGLYVRRAGKVVRRAEASVGVWSSRWTWDEEGSPASWEDTATYAQRYISRRQNRDTLAGHMTALGFDPVRYMNDLIVAREARFRGS